MSRATAPFPPEPPPSVLSRPPHVATPPAARVASLARCFLPLLAAVPLIGCGDGRITRYPVMGQVTVDGQPFEGARVIFCPKEGQGSEAFQAERPFGITDQQGRFELTTFEKGDGAPAGDYNVVIRTSRAQSREQYDRWKNRPPLDKRYGRPADSGVTATIAPNPNELAPFDLQAAGRTARR